MFDRKIVALGLDLYSSGPSLRKIVRHLSQFYGFKVTDVTAHGWIQRYMKIAVEYVAKFRPVSFGVSHADEINVKVGEEWV